MGFSPRDECPSVKYKKVYEYLLCMNDQGSSIKKTRYAHYNINYHLVWIPKYRKNILTDEVKEYLTEVLNEIADKKEKVGIISLEIQPDHIHLFISAPPRYSPAKLVNIFKGASSRRLRNEFPELKKKDKLWTRTYYLGTAGNVSSEVIRRYIEECQNV